MHKRRLPKNLSCYNILPPFELTLTIRRRSHLILLILDYTRLIMPWRSVVDPDPYNLTGSGMDPGHTKIQPKF